MRVLFLTIGSRGDVQPVVALASHPEALGHEGDACVPPDFREWVESPGIRSEPIGREVRRFAASRPTATQPQTPLPPAQRRQMMEATVEAQFETLTSAARDRRATALQVAARSVAEMFWIPYVVFAAYAPVVLPLLHHAPPPLLPLPGQAPAHDERQQ